MKISVIVPFYNEAENVSALADELSAVHSQIGSLEAVFVDDGSSDGTWEQIQQAGDSHPFIRPLRMPKNRGQSAAMLAGIRAAAGDILVTMDGDLQNDPADIPKLIEAIEGFDVVCGYRAKRKDTISKIIASRIGNRVRKMITKDGIRDTGCSLKAFRRECGEDLPPLDGVHRFMPAYFKLHGRKVAEVPVNHRERIHGQSKYTNLKRLPRTAFDLVGFCWYRRRAIRR